MSIFSAFHVSRFRKKAIHVSRLDPFQTQFREQLTRFYHKESSSPHPATVPIEGAVLFELGGTINTIK
jgi:hypothetical protein